MSNACGCIINWQLKHIASLHGKTYIYLRDCYVPVVAQTRRGLDKGTSERIHCDVDPHVSQVRHPHMNDAGNEDKSSIAKLFEQGGNNL